MGAVDDWKDRSASLRRGHPVEGIGEGSKISEDEVSGVGQPLYEKVDLFRVELEGMRVANYVPKPPIPVQFFRASSERTEGRTPLSSVFICSSNS